MHSSRGLQSTLINMALVMLVVTLWLALRGYHGLTGDGQIYAFQALARIQPQLANDLYLQNVSQDRFTIFSSVYAWAIGLLGIEHAARLLTLLFTSWLLAASWSAVRALAGREAAWLAIAFLQILDGSYGAAGVFRISEQFLTARLPAEALIATALACRFHGRKRAALAIAAAALFVHPLIALPGLLFLACLSVPLFAGSIAAAAGVLAALAIAAAAMNLESVRQLLPLMDSAWLNVVQERSQFLFLQLWSFRDWDLNARPFLCLAFIVIAVPDHRIRKTCLAAGLVGAAGLAVALIASFIGPVAILVQGQAWRWVWIPVLVSALLVPATVLSIWKDDRCGPLCAALLIAGWISSPAEATACISLAMILWLTRGAIDARLARYLRPLHLALQSAVAAGIGACRAAWAPALFGSVLIALSVFLLPAAFKQSRTLGAIFDIAEFSEWRNAIPPDGTVLVAPPTDVGAFVWFTLQRSNYLALDQSAGAVFSRATAMEIKRRSEVLLPVTDPDWKILTELRAGAAAGHKISTTTRPLTANGLREICTDPKLGFVISRQDVGFGPLRHRHTGPWDDWNLYDCRRVRAARPAASAS